MARTQGSETMVSVVDGGSTLPMVSATGAVAAAWSEALIRRHELDHLHGTEH